jgi:competence protein ComEC
LAEVGIDERELRRPAETNRWLERLLALLPQLWPGLIRQLEAEQDRWFLWVPVMFGGGVVAYFFLPSEPLLSVALIPVAVAFVISQVWRQGIGAIIVGGAVLAASLGFGLAKLRTEIARSPVLERQYGLVDVSGYIELVEPRPNRGQRLTIRVVSFGALAAEKRPYRIRVRTMVAVPGLKPGDGIRVKATLAPPAIPSLPGDYDFARQAWFNMLGGVGFALAKPVPDPHLTTPPLSLQFWAGIEKVRWYINRRISTANGTETGEIAKGLITGERGGITQATNDAYRDSGLFHILSISGLHMVIMAGAIFWLMRFGLALWPRVALEYPIKKWAAAGATIAALGYLLISGSSPATVRSWITITVMFFAIILDRPAVALRNVALSALLILLVFPENLFDLGFQMSYAAVVALVATYEWLREREQRREAALGPRPECGMIMNFLLFFGGIVASTLIAGFAVAPFTIYHFHNTQQYAVLANMIALPLCDIIVMPAALGVLLLMPFGLEALPLWVMGHGIDAMTWVAYAVARLPGAVVRIPSIPTLSFALMVTGGLWLCLWMQRWRVLGIAAIAAGIGLAPTKRHPDILAGRDGALVAVRTAANELSALPAKGAEFELTRWLEHDGDRRKAKQVTANAFRCDAAGCTASVQGVPVAVVRHPAALADDCIKARVLLLVFPKPQGCMARGLAVDFFDFRARGTHALYVDGKGDAQTLRLVTVADVRGDRPWALIRDMRRSISGRDAAAGSRLGSFAAPWDLNDGVTRPRPEIEDDDAPFAPMAPGDDEPDVERPGK